MKALTILNSYFIAIAISYIPLGSVFTDAAYADKEAIGRNNPNNISVFALRALLTQQLQLIKHTSLSYPELK